MRKIFLLIFIISITISLKAQKIEKQNQTYRNRVSLSAAVFWGALGTDINYYRSNTKEDFFWKTNLAYYNEFALFSWSNSGILTSVTPGYKYKINKTLHVIVTTGVGVLFNYKDYGHKLYYETHKSQMHPFLYRINKDAGYYDNSIRVIALTIPYEVSLDILLFKKKRIGLNIGFQGNYNMQYSLLGVKTGLVFKF